MQIDPSLRGMLPPVSDPTPFRSSDGRFSGWKVTLPGGHSLASPAVVNGRIFLGGGFGSYDFYAFNAGDGTLAWQYQTSDDGPTAAVVDDDHVVFNTESCELEVLTTDGVPVWKKVFWKTTVGRSACENAELLDSTLTPPSIANGKLFFGSVDGDLHCLSAATGEELWKVSIGEPVVFQPAVAQGRVYLGTDSGSLVCLETGDPNDDGWLMWGADAAHNGRLD